MESSFIDTLKWTLATYKESYVKCFFGLLISFFVVGALSTKFLIGLCEPKYYAYLSPLSAFWIVTWVIASMIFASMTFANLQDKHSRTWFMMLPAKKSHKFWARILINFLLGTIVTFVSMLCVDGLLMAIQFIFHGEAYSTTVLVFNVVADIEEPVFYVLFGLMILVSYTTYILGSVIFRKWAWLFTTIAWNVIWTIFMFVFGSILVSCVDEQAIKAFFDNYSGYPLAYAFFVVEIVIITFNLWMSYWIFSRMQLINGKWLNI